MKSLKRLAGITTSLLLSCQIAGAQNASLITNNFCQDNIPLSAYAATWANAKLGFKSLFVMDLSNEGKVTAIKSEEDFSASTNVRLIAHGSCEKVFETPNAVFAEYIANAFNGETKPESVFLGTCNAGSKHSGNLVETVFTALGGKTFVSGLIGAVGFSGNGSTNLTDMEFTNDVTLPKELEQDYNDLDKKIADTWNSDLQNVPTKAGCQIVLDKVLAGATGANKQFLDFMNQVYESYMGQNSEVFGLNINRLFSMRFSSQISACGPNPAFAKLKGPQQCSFAP
ncbi:hypothetical protein E1162_03885 [Rhodobacteraceae bacterium RKSG542]|uniref:hypothetical protein n=1 Tax=Pseudovibrio flavus TaxID=2529854 RepID=UPI0012BD729A|nr:hypothetical protein [Pseudovibrio flavus]MTI16379.1 hypothetical protein [Pseudovibrio flavus]